MQNYLPLFTISVFHDYFADGRCKGLRFTPTAGTAKIIDATGLIVRCTDNGLHLFYDEDKLENLRLHMDDAVEPLRFLFTVKSLDPHFFNYTHPEIFKKDEILHFHARDPDEADSASIRLSKEKYVSGNDYDGPDAPMVKAALTPRERRVKPHFIISITPDPARGRMFDNQGRVVDNHYHLRFHARKTYWKYIITSRDETRDLYLSDDKKETTFIETESPRLPGRKKIVSFITGEPIELSEKPCRCFKLSVRESGRDKKLINKIPVAGVSVIHKRSTTGEPDFLSEIFINL
ncbi:MAG: hypothetical protein GY859_18690 [Desulfobacterales bacterium]|nr:hypothetical protein [Desulfobacterales bacterium]